MRKIDFANAPFFQDDQAFSQLRAAIARSHDYLRTIPLSRSFFFAETRYTAGELAQSLQEFDLLLRQKLPAKEFNRIIHRDYEIFQASGRDNAGAMLVTGYYEPIVNGSITRELPFVYPLYRPPQDLVLSKNGRDRKKRVWRLDKAGLFPYWTRAEIETKQLLTGSELCYLADPVEVFLMQVQGSGQIRLKNGTIVRARYAADNGREYRSIGRLLAEEGRMPLAEVNLPTIIQYLKNHPEEQERILRYNERFIFFDWDTNTGPGPRGTFDHALTAGRSIALDKSCFPPGALGFLKTRQPIVNDRGEVCGWEPLFRFVLNQDTGGAINGAGRVDLFWGSGEGAKAAAGVMKNPGALYFLVRKK